MTRSAHPQPDTLLVYGLGLLGNPEGNDASGEAQEIARHLSGCVSCRMTWDELRAFYADLSARLATLPADAFTEPPELSLEGDPESDVPGVGERGLVGALAQIRHEQNGAARRAAAGGADAAPPAATVSSITATGTTTRARGGGTAPLERRGAGVVSGRC